MLLHLVGGEHHRRGANPQHTIFIRLCDENVPVGGVPSVSDDVLRLQLRSTGEGRGLCARASAITA